MRAAYKKWAQANPRKVVAYSQKWQAKNRTHLLAYDRRRAGLPEPTRAEPLLCECCGRPSKTQHLALDHCHVSGMFRGWLCKTCNVGIGALGDTAQDVRNALHYLERAATLMKFRLEQLTTTGD